MRRRGGLRRDRRGVAAFEFALTAPFAIVLLVGISQLGLMFAANASLRHAVDEGARYATIYPRPSDSDISAMISHREFMMTSSRITGPSFSHGTSDGVPYIDITMGYIAPMNFVLFSTPPITLSYTRRAYQS